MEPQARMDSFKKTSWIKTEFPLRIVIISNVLVSKKNLYKYRIINQQRGFEHCPHGVWHKETTLLLTRYLTEFGTTNETSVGDHPCFPATCLPYQMDLTRQTPTSEKVTKLDTLDTLQCLQNDGPKLGISPRTSNKIAAILLEIILCQYLPNIFVGKTKNI